MIYSPSTRQAWNIWITPLLQQGQKQRSTKKTEWPLTISLFVRKGIEKKTSYSTTSMSITPRLLATATSEKILRKNLGKFPLSSAKIRKPAVLPERMSLHSETRIFLCIRFFMFEFSWRVHALANILVSNSHIHTY